MIILQTTHEGDISPGESIPRLNKSEMTSAIADGQEGEFENFICQKKSPMNKLQTSSLSSNILHHQEVSRNRAAENYFAFFQDVSIDKCPEYNVLY